FQTGEALRAGIDDLGVVDEEAVVLAVLAAADGGLQRLPQARTAQPVGDPTGDGAHDERAEVGAVARLVDAENPRHAWPSWPGGMLPPEVPSSIVAATGARGTPE